MLPPLAFVVILSMIKDAYEDYKRARSDRGENLASAFVYNRESKTFETRPWKDVKVGDLLKV